MSDLEKLNQIEARANAATKGRWDAVGGHDEQIVIQHDSGIPLAQFNDFTESHDLTSADAEFIAHTRTDVDWLIGQVRKRDAALRAVLHLAEQWEDSPMVGGSSAEQWEFDTLRLAGSGVREVLTEALT